MRSLVWILCCVPLAAQTPRYSFGLTGGIPLGRITPGSGSPTDESRRYTFGVSTEISLTDRIAVNVNPLYKRTGSSYSASFTAQDLGGAVLSFENAQRVRAHSLELPVIGKYYFGDSRRGWRPFAGAGFAFQSAWETIKGRTSGPSPVTGSVATSDYRLDRRTSTDVGAVFSTGVAMRRGRLQFVPEIRYTRWGSANQTRDRQQAEALFSIRF